MFSSALIAFLRVVGLAQFNTVLYFHHNLEGLT